MAHPERTSEEIQGWIVDYLANKLDLSPDEIDVTAPFEEFAIDSATVIMMTGELEDWLGQKVDPALIFDHPTIETFSRNCQGNVRPR